MIHCYRLNYTAVYIVVKLPSARSTLTETLIVKCYFHIIALLNNTVISYRA